MRIYSADEFMTANRHIHIFEGGVSTNPIDILPHSHEFIEIVYVLTGKMIHKIDNQEYLVKQGDVIFMNCGCTHSFYSEEEYSYINILFSPERINGELLTPANATSLLFLTVFDSMRKEANFGKVSFAGTERKEVADIISAMVREYTDQLPSWEMVLENYLNTLIIKMLRKIEIGITSADLNDVWRELSEYIEENLDGRISERDLARKFFYNPSYFSRIFKEKFGMTFVEYVTRKRLEHAMDLLRNTELSVEKIGQMAGFSDSKSFYRAFSGYLNCTPAQYRKNK